MANVRLIARLDIKSPNLIKGIHLEGLRKLGDPQQFAQDYYAQGADELIYMDIVASLYNRNSLSDLVRRTAEQVFIPITVGGGLRSLKDVEQALRSGADKVAINTAAVARPELITEVATRFGSQCMVLGIEAKADGNGRWEAFTDNGRERTGLDVVEWARRGVDLGAGEILLTSVDQEGTKRGFDTALTKAVSNASRAPVIASGGMGTMQHLVDVVHEGHADAVAMAGVIHYKRMSFAQMRDYAQSAAISVRHQ